MSPHTPQASLWSPVPKRTALCKEETAREPGQLKAFAECPQSTTPEAQGVSKNYTFSELGAVKISKTF